jgi:hypothetical protein|tara:strand:+ start:205 stop:519 length:315 start_codon:yes stop_codon:yes gene_type:complete
MLKEVFLENTDEVTSGQAATNRYLKALTGILANANIITPGRVQELCPVFPLCRGARKLAFTTLLNHLKPLTAANLPDSLTTDGQFLTQQRFVDIAVAPVRILRG